MLVKLEKLSFQAMNKSRQQEVVLQTLARQQEVLRSIPSYHHHLASNIFSFSPPSMGFSESSVSPTSSSESRLSFSDTPSEHLSDLPENFEKKTSFRIADILKHNEGPESKKSSSSAGFEEQVPRKSRVRVKSNDPLPWSNKNPDCREKTLQFGVNAILSSLPKTIGTKNRESESLKGKLL